MAERRTVATATARDGRDEPPEDVFRVTLDAAIGTMLDGLEARGYRVPRFAFAFDAELPDGTPIYGERVTDYTGWEGADALARAALRVLEASSPDRR